MLSRIIDVTPTKSLTIKQNLDYGYAGEVWDASLVMGYFMINSNSEKVISFKNKSFIELGAGTGILGLIAATKNASKVVLTDKGDCIGMLKENYETNKHILNNETSIEIKELDWMNVNDLHNIKDHFDYIIGSDLVWKDELIKPLHDVIEYLMNMNNSENGYKTQTFLCFQIRDTKMKTFCDSFDKSKYKIEKIPDSLYDEEYKADDIIIVRIKHI